MNSQRRYMGTELPDTATPTQLRRYRSLLWRLNDASLMGDSQAVNHYSKQIVLLDREIAANAANTDTANA